MNFAKNAINKLFRTKKFYEVSITLKIRGKQVATTTINAEAYDKREAEYQASQFAHDNFEVVANAQKVLKGSGLNQIRKSDIVQVDY